jgi:hypothetical protein
MLANYLRLILFSLGLLIGVQAPGFVDQYVKRVSAHQIEVARDFKGFQEAADRNFGGSVEALIEHNIRSTDPAFQDEGTTIKAMYQRLTDLSAEVDALKGPLIQQILRITLHPNREILEETRAAYSYTVPLTPSAVVAGLVTGTCLAVLVEAIFLTVVRLVR